MRDTFDPFVEDDVPRGPKGGQLNTPYANAKAEWRQKGFNGTIASDGTIGSHRFVREHDVAVTGFKDEQPWHTMAAYMRNAGMTHPEIAMAAGVKPSTVAALCAQRWFQEKCAMIANRDGEEILGALKGYALESIEAIHDIATSAESDRVRLSAHLALLEHAHGKPVQKVVSDISHRVAASPTEEMENIQAELAALRAKPVEVLSHE